MLQPKRVKHRKVHRGRMKGSASRGASVAFGEFGLRVEESTWITARQIEAARRVLVRFLRRGGHMWIRIFPDKPVTKKPAETRMGGGKGATEEWVAVAKRGRVIFEVDGIGEEEARKGLRQAAHKLPVSTSFVMKEGEGS